jgi:hypothetical protein
MIPAAASSVTVDVYDGSSTSGLAANVSQDLVAMGYKAGAVKNSSAQSQPVQTGPEVFYGAGGATEASAQTIADVMGAQSATALSSLPSGHVEVLLGSQVTAQAPGLEMLGADSVNAADYVSAAQENNQSVPSNVQAAAKVGLETDVPAYSQPLGTSTGATPSPSASKSSASKSSASKSSASKSSAHASSSARKKPPASATPKASSSSSANPPYGLTTCPY